MRSQPWRKLPARLRGCESNCPTAIARRSALNSAGAVRLAAQQGRQHTLDSTTKRRARSMDDRLECDSGLIGTSARASPCIILSARCGQHVGVAKVIVNNNPETMKVPQRSFRTATSWSSRRPNDCRPGRAQREPGPITTGSDHGSPLSRGRPERDWLGSFRQNAPSTFALMLRSIAAQWKHRRAHGFGCAAMHLEA